MSACLLPLLELHGSTCFTLCSTVHWIMDIQHDTELVGEWEGRESFTESLVTNLTREETVEGKLLLLMLISCCFQSSPFYLRVVPVVKAEDDFRRTS
jgi:hypothetical protein